MKKRCLLLVYIFTIIVLIVGCKNQKQTLMDISITDIINNKITFHWVDAEYNPISP